MQEVIQGWSRIKEAHGLIWVLMGYIHNVLLFPSGCLWEFEWIPSLRARLRKKDEKQKKLLHSKLPQLKEECQAPGRGWGGVGWGGG